MADEELHGGILPGVPRCKQHGSRVEGCLGFGVRSSPLQATRACSDERECCLTYKLRKGSLGAYQGIPRGF